MWSDRLTGFGISQGIRRRIRFADALKPGEQETFGRRTQLIVFTDTGELINSPI